MLSFKKFLELRKDYTGESFKDSQRAYNKYYDFNRKIEMNCCDCLPNMQIGLAPLQTKTAVPSKAWIINDTFGVTKEGINPMRYNDNYATASASVSAQPSDTAVTRDYLLGRLAKADHPKDGELRKFFNLYTDNTPKTYKDMIAIIQAGTYTIDPKIAKRIDDSEADAEDMDCDFGPNYYGGPLNGIIWPGPKNDWEGFAAASKEKTKQYTAAKDIIMTDVPNGLAAIQAFEAWMPAATAVAN